MNIPVDTFPFGGANMELRKEKTVFAKLGFTDMRKQINGLSMIVQQMRPDGPFDGSYYVFCGKTRRVLKILYWDKNGFCLWLKRLEKDSFPWPREGEELNQITRQNIKLLLKGIDMWREHKALSFRIAG
jgi:transposase